jgi:uridine kinase
MSEAVEAILAAARSRGPQVVVGVTGAVASGKSTLARALSPCIVSTDHYLPDYDRTPEHLRDLPDSSDLDRLARDLAELRAGRATMMPHWTFETHSRIGERPIEPAPLVVVEGLHALHALPRAHVDVAVFVEAPREVRWARAVARERAGDRPWPLEYLEHFFHTVAEPTFARHAEAYRAGAHFVVTNDGSFSGGSA